MGLQLLGLGFTFGGKDAGLDATLNKVNDGFQQLKANMDFVSSAGSAFGDMISTGFAASGAMGFLEGATGGVLSVLAGGTEIVSDFMGAMVPPNPRTILAGLNGMREGMNLTTGMEGALQALNVQARAIGANFGYTGRALSDFSGRATGLADGLNIGAAEAAGAIRAFDEAGSEFRALGFDNARDVARFTAGFGVNADVLRNTAMQMTREFGLSTDAVGRVMSAVAAYGQASGDVAGAMGLLPDMMAAMRTQASAMGMELDPDRMESYARQSMGLAAGLFAIGQDSATARAAAMELNTALIASQVNFQNLFSGTASDMDAFTREMAISTGSVTTAFDMMRSGPEGFVEGMVDMVRGARENGELTDRQLDFVRARLESVLGSEASGRLVNFFRTADDAALASMSTVRDATRDLGEMGAEAHRTGRTMAETFERIHERAEMAFRSIARPEAGRFVRETSEHMRDFSRNVRDAAVAGGPFGDLLHRMSLADQIGGFAYLPEALRGTAMVAGEMGNQINDTISSFTSLGGIMDMAGMGVALFTTRVIENRDEAGSWGEAIANTAEEFSAMAVDAIDDAFGPDGFIFQALDQFANFDFGSMLDTGDSGIGGALARVFERLGDIDWEGMAKRLGSGLSNLWTQVEVYLPAIRESAMNVMRAVATWLFENIPWAEMAGLLGDGLAFVWEHAEPHVTAGLGAMFDSVVDHLPEIAIALGSGLVAWLTGPAILAFVGAGLGLMGEMLLAGLGMAIASVMGPGILTAIGTIFAGIGTVISGPVVLAVGAAALALWGIWELWGDDITAWFSETWDNIVSGFTERFPRIAAAIQRAAAVWSARIQMFADFFSRIWEGLSGWFSEMWTEMGGSASTATAGIMADLAPVIAMLGGWFDNVMAIVGALGEMLIPIVDAVGEAIINGLMDPIAPLQAQWTLFSTLFTTIWTTMEQLIGPAAQRIGEIFTNLGATASGAFEGVMGTVVDLFGNSVNTVVGEDMAATEAVVMETTEAVAAHLQEVLFGATVRALTEGFANAFQQIIESGTEFSDVLGHGFEMLADSISETMVDLYTRVVTGAALAATGIDAFVAPIIARLGQLADAQDRLISARAEAESLTSPLADTSRTERLSDLSTDLRAIHDPDWYRNDYRDLFITKMNQVIAAASASGGATPNAGISEDQLRTILGAIGETRRGGGSEPLGGVRATRSRSHG